MHSSTAACVFLILGTLAFGEEAPLLVPKRIAPVPSQSPVHSPPPVRHPASAARAPRSPAAESPWAREWHVQLSTPLIVENTFDRRFQALGLGIGVRLPVARLNDSLVLAVDGGLRVSLAIVSLTAPQTTFAHFYFQIPLFMELLWSLSPSVSFGMLGGGRVDFLEWDTRSGASGGLFVPTTLLEPDGGLELATALGSDTVLRWMLTYQMLAVALSFEF